MVVSIFDFNQACFDLIPVLSEGVSRAVTVGLGQFVDFTLGHRLGDPCNQSIKVLDLLGCGLTANGGDFLLGRFRLGCGLCLGLALGLGLGFLDHDDGLGPLFPEDAVAAVLEMQQAGAVTLKVRGLGPLAALGQEQLVVALVLGGAEKVDDEHICSRPLLALERLLKR